MKNFIKDLNCVNPMITNSSIKVEKFSYNNLYLLIKTLFLMIVIILFTAHPANAQESIDEVTSGIDRVLLEKNEQDIRDWLDARIRESGDFGVYSWGGEAVKINGDVATVKLIRGAIADAAAQFFRAYEMLGDKKYLEAGLKTADFFLSIQQPAGHFPRGAAVNRNGSVNVTGNAQIARIQDGYQFRPFALLLYSYKLTGDKKYLAGAKKLADFITRRVQNPDWGWCPDEFDTSVEGDVTMQKQSSGVYGVRGGGSYNDFATTDGCRISIMMYHVTGNKEYLKNTAKIGKWIFATQLGKGEVRGWADSYNINNEPVVQRHFEGLMIDPRNFDRFIAPLTIWLYLITSQEKYADLFRESYLWLKAQEHPNGWAAEYDYDGREVWTQDYVTYRYDQPETWPKTIKAVEVGDGKPWYSRDKVQLEDSKIIYELLQKGGREALLKWYVHSPVKYTSEQYMVERIAAAQRCTNNELKVIVRCTGCGKAVECNFLERVHLRLAKPDACICFPNSLDYLGRHGLEFQSWHGPHTWTQPYRPPYGWASWQYVWDGRLALGLIDPDTAASGGRGMENMHYWPAWDVMGDWTTRCLEVENWFDIPLAGFFD